MYLLCYAFGVYGAKPSYKYDPPCLLHRPGTENASCAPTVRQCWPVRNSLRERTSRTAPAASGSCLPNGARPAPSPSRGPAAPSSSHSKVTLWKEKACACWVFTSFEADH